MILWQREMFDRCNCSNPRCNCAGAVTNYREPYRSVVNLLAPQRVLEWGPGQNTEIALAAGAWVHSVESHQRFLHEHRERLIQIFVANTSREYPTLFGQHHADLYFVDGFRRRECLTSILNQAAKPSYVAVLHDAQRERYWEVLDRFTYVIQPERWLVIATFSDQQYKKLTDLFNKKEDA